MKRAAIIGLGDISQIHIAGILANPEITLCGLCDINPEANQGRQRFRIYPGYFEFFMTCGERGD